jgi:cell division septum initiation protein DivIVA
MGNGHLIEKLVKFNTEIEELKAENKRLRRKLKKFKKAKKARQAQIKKSLEV